MSGCALLAASAGRADGTVLRLPRQSPGDLDVTFSGDGRVSTLTSPDTSWRARWPSNLTDESSSPVIPATRNLRPDRATPRSGSSATRPTAGSTPTSASADGHHPGRRGAARRRSTSPLARTAAIVAAGVASARHAAIPARSRSPATSPTARSTRRSAPAAARSMRVGSGTSTRSPTSCPARATRSSRSARRRPAAATASRSPATTAAACPTRASAAAASLVVPTSALYAYGAAGARLPDGRVVAVGASGLELRGREPPLQRRRPSARRRDERAVDPPRRRLLLLRQRRRGPARRARARRGGRHRDRRQPGDGDRTPEPGGRARPLVGRRRPRPRPRPRRHRRDRRACSTRRDARWLPGTSARAPAMRSCSRASTATACWTQLRRRGVLTASPGAAVARATALPASPTACSSQPASPARRAAACSAMAGPRDSRCPLPGRARPGPPAAGGPGRHPPPAQPRFVSLPWRVRARRGKRRAGAHPLRSRPPAAAARSRCAGCGPASRRGCSARARSRSRAAARRRSRRGAAALRRSAWHASAGCACRSSSRAATPPARAHGDAPRGAPPR